MDIQAITQCAKDLLLEHGDHMPTIYIEFEGNQVELIVIDHLEETTRAKMLQFFKIARGLALDRHWKATAVREIIFVVEAWLGTYEKGEEMKYAQVADDPNRKEVLIVSKMAVTPGLFKPRLKTTMQTIEMLRVGGELVDLLPAEEVHVGEHSLLQSFMAGLVSTEYSPEQLASLIERL
jgi:hypothetical protein